MRNPYYLAIDIGASSGRHILGQRQGDKLLLEEVYRFPNLSKEENGHLVWDEKNLQKELVQGLKAAGKRGQIPERVGITSFGVDYGLLKPTGELIEPLFSYRDARGEKAKEKVADWARLYALTGTQPFPYNTYFQMRDDQEQGRLKKQPSAILFAALMGYFLTGKKHNERSALSTTGFFDSDKKQFSDELLRELGLTPATFAPTLEAGSLLGPLKEEIAAEVGYQTKIYATLEHDTAAAFKGALPTNDEVLISSGTWSLLGVLRERPLKSGEAYEAGYTNEIGDRGLIRFLKNIPGMFIFNELRKEAGHPLSAPEAVALAKQNSGYQETFDLMDPAFLSAGGMREKIARFLPHHKPQNDGEYFNAFFWSLASTYATSIADLTALTGFSPRRILIFGGGSKNDYLNHLIEIKAGLPVRKGSSEATASGAILGMMPPKEAAKIRSITFLE